MKTLSHLWHLTCQNKLFSAIYIFGTALALATVTMFAVVMWNKLAPVYPEYNRDRTAYMRTIQVSRKSNGGYYQGSMSREAARDYFGNLPSIEKISIMADVWGDCYVQPETGDPDVKVRTKPTDPAFFEIYTFKFLAGKPFSDADFESGLRTAVISDGLARKAFGNVDYEEIIGREISLDFKKYKVCGVVKEGTPTEIWSYANIFFPYTSGDYRDQGNFPLVGQFKSVILTDDIEALRAEAQGVVDRYNSSEDEYELSLLHSPLDHATEFLGNSGYDEDFTIANFLLGMGMILLVLLLVPALNLSGMISGRMEERLAEMGVRKSFGATRGRLLRDVLWENLLLTVAGGIVGFFLAWLLLQAGISNLAAKGEYGLVCTVTSEMVFSPVIFVFTFVICCVLNVMSALVPAWRSLRRPIVQSLKEC